MRPVIVPLMERFASSRLLRSDFSELRLRTARGSRPGRRGGRATSVGRLVESGLVDQLQACSGQTRSSSRT
jgi:hypothetical protein